MFIHLLQQKIILKKESNHSTLNLLAPALVKF